MTTAHNVPWSCLLKAGVSFIKPLLVELYGYAKANGRTLSCITLAATLSRLW